jgi:hypothetical protein
MESASLGDLRSPNALEVGAARRPHALKGDAQDRVSKGGQKRPTSSLRLWSVPFEKPKAGFRGRSAALRARRPDGNPTRKKVAQKRTQVVETIGPRKLVRGAETGKRS